MAFNENENLRHGKQADDGHKKINTVKQVEVTTREARQSRGTIHTHHGDPKTQTNRNRRLGLIV